jgi:hypothetical protein
MHKLKIIKKINLDSLAKYSQWPQLLLSSKIFKKYKTKKEIIREFNDEKWKKIYKTLNDKKKYSILEAEKALNNPDKITICYDHDKGFCLSKNKEINKYILKILEDKIKKHLSSASCLVELGAGFGSKILQLSKIFKEKKLNLFAGEYTSIGRNLIKIIANYEKININVKYCDLNNLKNLKIPKNSVIFTSYSMHYVSKLNKNFVKIINNLNPKIIIHFEPCYELYDSQNLHGLMCKKYIEINDYNKNLYSILKQKHLKNKIDLKITKNIFGHNPLLPISILEWKKK